MKKSLSVRTLWGFPSRARILKQALSAETIPASPTVCRDMMPAAVERCGLDFRRRFAESPTALTAIFQRAIPCLEIVRAVFLIVLLSSRALPKDAAGGQQRMIQLSFHFSREAAAPSSNGRPRARPPFQNLEIRQLMG